jgi:hypothetical protein
MSFQLYGNGRTGEVLIEDQRPDGSVVMLVCNELASRPVSQAVGSNSPAQGNDTNGDPVAVVTASTMDGGAYPLLNESGKVSRRLPKVHVDTTDMPGGIMRFAMSVFGRRALQAAEDGVREVRLHPREARDWGWIPEDFDQMSADARDPLGDLTDSRELVEESERDDDELDVTGEVPDAPTRRRSAGASTGRVTRRPSIDQPSSG